VVPDSLLLCQLVLFLLGGQYILSVHTSFCQADPLKIIDLGIKMDGRRKWSPGEDALLVEAYRIQASSKYQPCYNQHHASLLHNAMQRIGCDLVAVHMADRDRTYRQRRHSELARGSQAGTGPRQQGLPQAILQRARRGGEEGDVEQERGRPTGGPGARARHAVGSRCAADGNAQRRSYESPYLMPPTSPGRLSRPY
jgi:hypothetical protein